MSEFALECFAGVVTALLVAITTIQITELMQ